MKLDPKDYAAVAARAQLLVTPEEIDAALDRMAASITERLAGKDPLVLCVMTGAVFVAGLLLPRLQFQLRVDYIHASRYQGRTSGGEIAWRYRPSDAIRGEHVLVLDDILDEGITLRRIVDACHEDGAASVHTAVLVSKEREHACEADVVGVHVEDRYLYGYGLDYKDYFRNAAGIYAVADDDV
ncbi:hypoxanthine-guanine phosphoribosyltransferase [Thiocapsa roseopersicina]|uniref:Hypoxanthine phosphoribosyltransferase n=1 Tax=Thiocapsa roseopersicina TaxID=1058 RepID=A0A1H3ADD1_THIRO|nr:hypoxanthine-guanine phosphoribosyltransferase [Thiocapsa roseopersicina]SDX27663.1 hypoxanthine phosphoribosyltransferase [Thiocapsa roseopersicina]